jgi:hypothetical protein
MVIHVKIFNKYGYAHKTNNNYIIDYDEFKKKRGIKTTEKYWILSLNWLMIFFWCFTLFFSFALYYSK